MTDTCSNPPCSTSIDKGWTLCRPCALAHTRDRYPYVEPCSNYIAEPVKHLTHFSCAECGFDSAAHPGSGRVRPEKVRIGNDRAASARRPTAAAGAPGSAGEPTPSAVPEVEAATERAETPRQRTVPSGRRAPVPDLRARARADADGAEPTAPTVRQPEAGPPEEPDGAAGGAAVQRPEGDADVGRPASVGEGLIPWNPSFGGRPCFSCGALPSRSFADGSPLYSCAVEGDGIHVARSDSPLFVIDDHPLSIELTLAELRQAEACAEKRISRALAKGSKDRLGYYSERAHRLGAYGERAFAKWAGVKWRCSTNDYGGKPDVAGVQVRAVGRADQRLVVHKNDPGTVPVVLILAHRPPLFELRGWIDAWSAKQHPEWLDDPDDRRPSYFVPQDALRDPATLRRFVHTT